MEAPFRLISVRNRVIFTDPPPELPPPVNPTGRKIGWGILGLGCLGTLIGGIALVLQLPPSIEEIPVPSLSPTPLPSTLETRPIDRREDPVRVKAPSPRLSAAESLLPTTNPNRRLAQITHGSRRSDPFAEFALLPVVVTADTPPIIPIASVAPPVNAAPQLRRLTPIKVPSLPPLSRRFPKNLAPPSPGAGITAAPLPWDRCDDPSPGKVGLSVSGEWDYAVPRQTSGDRSSGRSAAQPNRTGGRSPMWRSGCGEANFQSWESST